MHPGIWITWLSALTSVTSMTATAQTGMVYSHCALPGDATGAVDLCEGRDH